MPSLNTAQVNEAKELFDLINQVPVPEILPCEDKKDLQQKVKARNINTFANLNEILEGSGQILTITQVSRMFDITYVTLNKWRKNRNFPYFKIARGRNPAVLFDEGLVRKWAEMNGRAIVHEDFLDF